MRIIAYTLCCITVYRCLQPWFFFAKCRHLQFNCAF